MAAYVACFFELSNQSAGQVLRRSGSPLEQLEQLVRQIKAGKPHQTGGFIIMDDTTVLPEGTITVTAAGVTTATSLTFLVDSGVPGSPSTVTLTAGTDFDIDISSDDNQAALLAEAINSHPQLATILRVERTSNVLEVIAKSPYLDGQVGMVETGTDFGLVQIGSAVAGVLGEAPYFFVGRSKSLSGSGG